jgi:hypothetical protein
VSLPTKDIDLLGKLNNSTDAVMAAVKEACMQTADPDGMALNAGTVTATAITEDDRYKGSLRVQVKFSAERPASEVMFLGIRLKRLQRWGQFGINF